MPFRRSTASLGRVLRVAYGHGIGAEGGDLNAVAASAAVAALAPDGLGTGGGTQRISLITSRMKARERLMSRA